MYSMCTCVCMSLFSAHPHLPQELHKRGGTMPVWLDCESVTDSSDKECVYVLESFDCDCYSLLHGKFR